METSERKEEAAEGKAKIEQLEARLESVEQLEARLEARLESVSKKTLAMQKEMRRKSDQRKQEEELVRATYRLTTRTLATTRKHPLATRAPGRCASAPSKRRSG